MTPIVFDKALWQQSGHYAHYKEDMFFLAPEAEAHKAHKDDDSCAGHHERGLKPMNCPGHCLVFANTQVWLVFLLFCSVLLCFLFFFLPDVFRCRTMICRCDWPIFRRCTAMRRRVHFRG
jgi:hypothetical protein